MISATLLASGGGSAVIGGIKDIGGSLVGGIKDIFGGGNRATPEKRKQREQITQYLRAYTTAEERREFILSTGSSLDRIKPTPSGMAYFFTGEDDFYHKGVGQNHQNFLDRLPGWIQQKADEKATPTNNYSAASVGTSAGMMGKVLGVVFILGLAFVGFQGIK